MRAIQYSDHFAAAHRLHLHEGKCQVLHGHNWMVTVQLYSERVDNKYFIIDFKDLKERVKQICDCFDHRTLLCDKDPFHTQFVKLLYGNMLKDNCPIPDPIVLLENPPTCEFISEDIWVRLNSWIKVSKKYHIKEIRVFIEEAPNQGVWYAGEVSH